MPAPFRLYSTLTRSVEDFEPRTPGEVSIYVCGMTVYDHAHVGHARAFAVFDALQRYLRHGGWKVRYVRNFTDVDDKIIRKASETGEDSHTVAERYIASFRADMAALGFAAPDVEPRVTQSIPSIVEMIGALIERGHAYVSEGSVWFAVDSFAEYGKLSGRKVEEVYSEDAGPKRSAADFALWKAAKPGEPTWDTPWGPGRPGWHIECSAMACEHLGAGFDIHGGGLDLVFPHHENEIAQAEAAIGSAFARYWMHNGLLTAAGGQKMGHSLGNFVTIADALARFPAEALRLYYLQNHYRSPLPWNDDALPDALAMLARLYDARELAESMSGSEDADSTARELGADALKVLELGRSFTEKLYAALNDDFNTSLAGGHAFELARAINRFSNHKKARKRGGPIVEPALTAFALLRETTGLLSMPTAGFQEEVKEKVLTARGVDRAEIQQLLVERAEARATKDWARADALRTALDTLGITVMDRADGVEWRVRLER